MQFVLSEQMYDRDRPVLKAMVYEGIEIHVTYEGEYLGRIVGMSGDDYLLIDRFGVKCRYGPKGLRYAK